ncbi:MAG: hypothetical protein V3V74_07700 [Nitrosomonadaceae bacterium]
MNKEHDPKSEPRNINEYLAQFKRPNENTTIDELITMSAWMTHTWNSFSDDDKLSAMYYITRHLDKLRAKNG